MGHIFEKSALSIRLKDKRGSIKTTGPWNSEQTEAKFKNGTREQEKTATDRLEVKREKLVRRSYKKLVFKAGSPPFPSQNLMRNPTKTSKVKKPTKRQQTLEPSTKKEPGEKEPEKAIGKLRRCKLQA